MDQKKLRIWAIFRQWLRDSKGLRPLCLSSDIIIARKLPVYYCNLFKSILYFHVKSCYFSDHPRNVF